MDYLTIKTEIVERVGVITLDHPAAQLGQQTHDG